MQKLTITTDNGNHATAEERAQIHLQVTEVLNGGESIPAFDSFDMRVTATTYLSSIVADLLSYAETTGLDVQGLLWKAVTEYNDTAYQPLDVSVKRA